MLIGDSPFSGDDEDELFASIKEKAITFPADTDKKAQSLIMAFLCREPPNRLGAYLINFSSFFLSLATLVRSLLLLIILEIFVPIFIFDAR